MSIDCDEWVDPKITGYVAFLTTNKNFDFASVIIRNYQTLELDSGGRYSDFLAVRLLRLSTGIRYEGSIHERWPYNGTLETVLIRDAVFHHDGYVFQDPAKKREKQERNMELLKKQLENDPNNLITLTQCIESGDYLPEREEYLRRAMAGVEEKWSQWELFGPLIYRHAVRYALSNKLPELEEWIDKAVTMFPKSIFIRVEVPYFAFGNCWNKRDYSGSIYWGEKYLQGIEDYRAGRFNHSDILASSLDKIDANSHLNLAGVLASGYLHEKQPEQCLRLLETMDGKQMDAKQTGDYVRNLCNLYCHYDINVTPLLLRLWDSINDPVPAQERADQRRKAFLQNGAKMFEGKFIRSELDETEVIRHTYTVFLPLKDKCELGLAAEMLDTENTSELEALLDRVEDLNKLPPYALYHALNCGVPFPRQDCPLTIERMDILIAGIAQEQSDLFDLVRNIGAIPKKIQALGWARGLCMAALKVCSWKEIDRETGILLVRTFAQVEKSYLPVCYTAEILQEENLFLLPPFHRFGFYCTQAFDALDNGDATSYIRLLQEGLNTYEGAKEMVEFLIDHTPQLRDPSEELKDMAEQIRTILSKYSPHDPTVAALKQSEAYQKVAYLIEGAPAAAWGGLTQ